jgi:hypothetical protein
MLGRSYTMRRNRSWQTRAAYACLVILAVLAVVCGVKSVTEAPVEKDALENLTIGYNLFAHGIYSQELVGSPTELTTTDKREPVFPVMIACVLSLLRETGYVSPDWRPNDGPSGHRILRALKMMNPVMVVLTAFVVFLLAKDFTGKLWLGIAAFAIVGFHGNVDDMYTEILAALWLALHTWFVWRTINKPSWSSAVGAGIFLGLLALTKVVFYYYIYVVLVGVVAAFVFWKGLMHLKYVGSAVTVAVLICTMWITCNYAMSGNARICGRGALTLATRAEFDTMSWKHYAASYICFSPVSVAKKQGLASELFGSEIAADFDLWDPNGFYRKGMNGHTKAHALARTQGLPLQKAAILIIKENIAKHLALTLSFGWCGAFVSYQATFIDCCGKAKKYIIKVILLVGTMLVPAFWLVTVKSLFNRKWSWIVLALPALYSLVFHALFTFGWSRFTEPLLPVLALGLVVGLGGAYDYLKKRAKTETE